MQVPASRSVVIISGLLTLLVLGGGTLAVAFHNGWLQTGSDTPSETVIARTQPVDAGNEGVAPTPVTQSQSTAPTQGSHDEVGVYRQKLEEANRALDDAYAQIRSLQSAQPRLASARGHDEGIEHDGDDDHREQQSGRRESHDE